MSKELIVNSTSLENRLAIVEDDQITEIFIERQKNKGILGNIYKGRVTKVLPGMQAAFVDIGLERHAFLYVSDFFEDYEEYEELFRSAESAGLEEALRLEPKAEARAEAPAQAAEDLKRTRRSRRGRREPGRDRETREQPREQNRETVREASAEALTEPLREASREAAREPSRETLREATREPSRETLREATREPSRETLREATREPSREPSRGPRERSREPRESGRRGREARFESPEGAGFGEHHIEPLPGESFAHLAATPQLPTVVETEINEPEGLAVWDPMFLKLNKTDEPTAQATPEPEKRESPVAAEPEKPESKATIGSPEQASAPGSPENLSPVTEPSSPPEEPKVTFKTKAEEPA